MTIIGMFDRSRPERRRHPPDERGSMAILLMVMLVGLMLGGLLVPMIITQDRTTRFDSTRLDALNAAQSGIDVTLGVIRASVSDGIGVSSRLPCGPESGTVNNARVAVYSVAVEYFTFDPVNEAYPSTRAMKCIAGYGTFDAATGATTPRFARFVSTGTTPTATSGASTGRTLISTYMFRTWRCSWSSAVPEHRRPANRYSPFGPTSPCNCCPRSQQPPRTASA